MGVFLQQSVVPELLLRELITLTSTEESPVTIVEFPSELPETELPPVFAEALILVSNIALLP